MYRSFFVVVTAFLVGVSVRSVHAIGLVEVGFLVCCGLVALGVAYIQGFRHLLYPVLAIAVCALGVVRVEVAFHAYEAVRVFGDGVHWQGEGMVVAEPDVRDGYMVYWLDVPNGGGAVMRLRVKALAYPRYDYGDTLAVSGMLTVPRPFETETGRVFDYAGFLMKDGVHYELRDAVLERVSENGGNPVVAGLLWAKHAWLSALARLLPEPESALAGGVIVGAKRSLGEDWLEAFRVTGLIHIVVLSGYNLTLVANVIVEATKMFPRMVGFGLGALGVVCFALMTGGGATVVRASVMAILGMAAVFGARPYLVLRALGVAALVMVAWNPFVLVYDPGFQLSFMATVGLVLGSPVCARYLGLVPSRFGLREIVAATFATQIAVLPLLLYQIGQVSIVAPLVNVLVLPLVASMMLLGFLTGFVGMVSIMLAQPLAFLAHLLFSYTFMVVELFAKFPYASLTLPPVSPLFVALLYGVLTVVYLRMRDTTVGGGSVHR